MRPQLKKLQAAVKRAKAMDPNFLHAPAGRKLLKQAIALGLQWPELIRLFNRRLGTLANLLSAYQIPKPREKYQNWNDDLLALIKKFYKKSFKAARDVYSSSKLSQEMQVAVNKARRHAGLNELRLYAIRCFARGYGLRWGYNNNSITPTEAKISPEDRRYLKLI